jgi:hypothetical protein
MKTNRYPYLRKTENCLRALGYSERSIREIVGASRREIIRARPLAVPWFPGNGRESPNSQGGAPLML